jgi:Mal s 1 allergenic protein-like
MRRILAGGLWVAFCLAHAAWGAGERKVAHRVLGADQDRVAIVGERGVAEWEVPDPCEVHDLALLPNGNLLFPTGRTTIVEMTLAKQVVWQHVSKPKAGYDGPVEIHGFQRLANGLTMIAESGNCRIIEVDRDDRIVLEIPLHVEKPNSHRDTRLVRKLDNGNYLVCHEGDGAVREYDPTGKVVWSYTLDLAGRPRTEGHGPEGHGTEVFGAIRLPNRHTIIACGNGNRVIEVTPAGKVVWSIEQHELPGITLAWVTTLQLLPNGHLVIGNTHAGPANPQLIEVTRDKKVVWTFTNFATFGNALAAAQVLDVPGKVIR